MTSWKGIGLRKALEFLIKDYAIKQQPEKSEDIKKTPLGNVIKQYIDDTQVQRLAARATWLGNDETHYVRKWDDKDITHLRALVRLTVNAIDNKIEGDRHIAEMPDP